MRISFSPRRRDDTLTLEKTSGNRLRINGDLFNFDPLQDGDRIPEGEVPCAWIDGPVERVEGEVRLTVILPHGANPSQAVAFPEPITVTEDGPIAVPHDLTSDEIRLLLADPGSLTTVQMAEIEKRLSELSMFISDFQKEEPEDVDA